MHKLSIGKNRILTAWVTDRVMDGRREVRQLEANRSGFHIAFCGLEGRVADIREPQQ